jgi:hypothetical protein
LWLQAQLERHLIPPGPSEAGVRAEVKIRLQEALNGMAPLDRKVLDLGHFEQLTPAPKA